MKTKIDLYKLHKADYVTPKKPVLIQMKKAAYLAIAGQGEPGGAVFTAKIGALYGMAFTVKMTRKFGGKQDYAVCKLEAQWSAADGAGDFSSVPRDQWRWKLMIRTPEFVKRDELKAAVETLLKRGKGAEVQEVQLETLDEGRCVQMLHVGPYDREPESIAQMKAFAEAQGFKFQGLHHEIYLSDPRRVPAERLRTILRMPVTRG